MAEVKLISVWGDLKNVEAIVNFCVVVDEKLTKSLYGQNEKQTPEKSLF